MSRRSRDKRQTVRIIDATRDGKRVEIERERDPMFEPDWTGCCETCDAAPIVPATGLCGPCTFGEADTAGGNW